MPSRNYCRKMGWSYHWKTSRLNFKFEGSKKITRHKIPAIGYLKLSGILKINYYIQQLKLLPLSSKEFEEMRNILYKLFDNEIRYKFKIMEHGLIDLLFLHSDNDRFTAIPKLENISNELANLYAEILNIHKSNEIELDLNEYGLLNCSSLFENKLPNTIISYLCQYLDLISLEAVNATNRNLSIIARQFSSWHPYECNDIFSALFSIDNLVKSKMGKKNTNEIENIFEDKLESLNNEQIEECQILYQFAKFFKQTKEISEINKMLNRESYNDKDLKLKSKSSRIQHKIYKILKRSENELKQFIPKSAKKLESIKKQRAKDTKNVDKDTSNHKHDDDNGNMSIFSYSLTKRPSKPVNSLEINIDEIFIAHVLRLNQNENIKKLTVSDLNKISNLNYLPFTNHMDLDEEILQSVMHTFFGNTTKLTIKVGNSEDLGNDCYYTKLSCKLPPDDVMLKFIQILTELPFWKYWHKLTNFINIKDVIVKRIDNHDWSYYLMQNMIYNIAPNICNLEIVGIGNSTHRILNNFTSFLCDFIGNFCELDTLKICSQWIYKISRGIKWAINTDKYHEFYDDEEVQEMIDDALTLMKNFNLPKIKDMKFYCERYIPKTFQNYLFGIHLHSLEIILQSEFVDTLLDSDEDLFGMNLQQWNLLNLTNLKVTVYDQSAYDNWFELLYCPSLKNIELMVKYNQNSHVITKQKIKKKYDDDMEWEEEIEVRDNNCLTEIAVLKMLANKSKFVALQSLKFNYDQIHIDEDGNESIENPYNDYDYDDDYDYYSRRKKHGNTLSHIKMLDGFAKMIQVRNQTDLSLDISIRFDNKRSDSYNSRNYIDNTKDIWRYLLNFTETVEKLKMTSNIKCFIEMKDAITLVKHFNFVMFAQNKNNETSNTGKTFQYCEQNRLLVLKWEN
eukprot:38348_1